jgi:hypothetical protein
MVSTSVGRIGRALIVLPGATGTEATGIRSLTNHPTPRLDLMVPASRSSR